MVTRKLINKLLYILHQHRIFKLINNSSYTFQDEPRFHYYSALLNEKTSRYNIKGHRTLIDGISLTSSLGGFFRCIANSLAYLSLFYSDSKPIEYFSYTDLVRKKFPCLLCAKDFLFKKNILDKDLGWIQGYNFSLDISCGVPAQLIYMNYLTKMKYEFNRYEPMIIPAFSTGASCGLNHESAILDGIYSVLERYISFNLIRDKYNKFAYVKTDESIIHQLIKKFDHFNLDLKIFYLENELSVPAFLVTLIDNRGKFPKLTCGIGVGLNHKEAIIRGIEEVYMSRMFLKGCKKSKMISFDLHSKFVSTYFDLHPLIFSYHLYKKIPKVMQTHRKYITDKNIDQKKELAELSKIFKKVGYQIIYVNLKSSDYQLNNIPIFIYKTLIKGLKHQLIESAELRWNLNELSKCKL